MTDNDDSAVDRKIISLIKAGNEEGVALLVSSYQRAIVDALRKRYWHVRDPDIFVEAFDRAVCRLWSHPNRYDETRGTSLKAFVLQDACFRLLDILGDENGMPRPLDNQLLEAFAVALSTNEKRAQILNTLEYENEIPSKCISMVREALGCLTPAEEDVLALIEFAGWSTQQVADHLEKSNNTVSVLLCKARKKLRNVLSDLWNRDRE